MYVELNAPPPPPPPLVLQEAAELSSLKPQLDELGVPLYAVVKEDVGTEVQNFRPFFKGEVFLDEKVGLVIYFFLQ